MKKIILIFFSFVLIIIGVVSFTYLQSVKPIKIAKKMAVEIALNETRMEKVDDFQLYHGLESVYIVKGKNHQGEKMIVWISEKDKKPTVRMEKNGITEQQAIKKVSQLSKPKKIIDARLGMEKGIPLWEIYYRSDSNLINYYYLDFKTGEWIKKIENL